MSVEQTAGKWEVIARNEGSPCWVDIKLYEKGDAGRRYVEGDLHGLRPEDLHDLRYCIDRVLAGLERGR